MASMLPPKKNTAFTLSFSLYKNDGTIVANPGTYTKKVSIDGGAVADIAASVTEEDTTYGQLSLVLSASEMNGDWIWVYITDNTAGTVPFTCTLYTASNSLDDIKTDTAAIKTKTDYLPSATAGASGGVFIAGTNAATTITTGLTTTFTGNLTGSVASCASATLAANQHVIVDSGTVTDLTNLPAAAATAAELAKVPKSDSTVTWNATALASINAQCDTAISDAALATAAAVADIPTVAEFEARTLPSADYVVVTDTIAGVTLVGTCTTNTDMRGTDGAMLATENGSSFTSLPPVTISRPAGTVVADAGNSVTAFKTDLSSTVDNYWTDAWIKITSGALSGQVKKVSGYNGTSKVLTVVGGFTGIPAEGVTFVLVIE